MKRLFLILLMAFAIVSSSFAQNTTQVTASTAQKTAQAFVNTMTLKGQTLSLVSSDGVYVYNIGNQGFVIISGNTVLPPVLGWSDQGTFPDMEEAPDNFRSWIEHYSEMIDFAVTNGISPEADIQQQWDEARQGIFGTRNATTVDPLVSTRWNQDCFYNEYCPATTGGWWWGGGPCGHCYAGCVATAMAQVMKYWNYPETGFGSHSYVHSEYGELSANFGATTYHWDQMPVEIFDHNDAVATLLYHCGVSVNMNYSGSGSGAQSQDVETAMRSYFGYCGAKYRQKSSYQDEAWNAMLRAELDLSHPIYYSGANGDSGHAFVCDGYDSSGLFHFNFGWSGSGDAFYSTYDVNGFNQGQAVVTNVFPVSIQADANGIIYVSEDGTGDGSSWANATNKLQFASALSSGGGTSVWVKAGTYYGDTTDMEGAFNISKSNRVYGGFEGNEAPDYDLSLRDFDKNTTILDGQGARRVLLQDQAFTSGTVAIWDGFTIQNGSIGSGAGAYLNNYVTLNNCNILDNTATMYGGGIYINSTGGTAHVTLHNCVVMDNEASMGGGVCDRVGAEYTNCRVSNNIASTKGGGIYLYNSAEPVLKNCIISNNTSQSAGGMYARGQFTAYNCDFVMNLATESIGGIYHENSHNKYYNCIVWGNMANGLPNQFAGLSDFDHCAVCGIVNGSDNYDLPNENSGDEPGVFVRFNHPAQGAGADHHNQDWSLKSRSICLNAGKPNTTGLGTTDIAGNPRLQKGRVDIGAYESCASLTQIEDACYESNVYWFFDRPLTEPGYYTHVLDGPDCDSVIGLTLMILEGMEESQESNIQVWPNPTTGQIHIDVETPCDVEVRNVLGQLVLQATKAETLDISGLENGVYFLMVSGKNGMKAVTKITKE
ncbi:MAG: C10 family peptidase [Bacteroidales bacterium]|nr:C10 family peptidase [Bacteroidales bacterium]